MPILHHCLEGLATICQPWFQVPAPPSEGLRTSLQLLVSSSCTTFEGTASKPLDSVDLESVVVMVDMVGVRLPPVAGEERHELALGVAGAAMHIAPGEVIWTVGDRQPESSPGLTYTSDQGLQTVESPGHSGTESRDHLHMHSP